MEASDPIHKITTAIPEGGSFGVQLDFTDTDGSAVVPVSLSWSLVDQREVVINSREDVAITPASSVVITVSGDDNKIVNLSSDIEMRHIVVEGVYNSTTLGNNLPFKKQITYQVKNLKKVL